MKRNLIFSGTLCSIAVLLILFFYPGIPQPSGTRQYLSYGTPSKYVGTILWSQVPYRIVTQRMTTVQIFDVEIDWVPEYGMYLTLSVDIRKSGAEPSPRLGKAWSLALYNTTQVPFKRTIPFTISISDSDFDLPVGETNAYLTISATGNVMKPLGETETLIGGGSTGTGIVLVSENPLIVFFTTYAFGIGWALLLVGISIAVFELVMDVVRRKKEGETEGLT